MSDKGTYADTKGTYSGITASTEKLMSDFPSRLSALKKLPPWVSVEATVVLALIADLEARERVVKAAKAYLAVTRWMAPVDSIETAKCLSNLDAALAALAETKERT